MSITHLKCLLTKYVEDKRLYFQLNRISYLAQQKRALQYILKFKRQLALGVIPLDEKLALLKLLI